MGFSERIRGAKNSLLARAKSLKREIAAVYYAYQDARVRLLPKLVIALCIGYALSPIDLIPDFIPVLGYLDDLVIVPALLALAIKLIPPDAMSDARKRAAVEPIRLKDNWAFGALFIAAWATVVFFIARSIVKALG